MSLLSSSHLNPKTLTAAALAYAIHKSQEKEKSLDDYYDHVDPVLEHAPYERDTRTSSNIRPQYASVRRNIILPTPSTITDSESSRVVPVTPPPATQTSSLPNRKPRRKVKPVSLDEDSQDHDSGENLSSNRAISAAYRRQLKARQRVRVRAARLAQSDSNRSPTKATQEDATSASTSPSSTTQAPPSLSSSPAAPTPQARTVVTKQTSKRQILMNQQRSPSSKRLTRQPMQAPSQNQPIQSLPLATRKSRQTAAPRVVTSGTSSVTSSTEGKRTKQVRFKIKSATSTLVVRFQCAPTIQAIHEHLAQRLGQSQKMQLKYYDAENDCCLLTDDSDVEEAVRAALIRRDTMVRLEMEPDTKFTSSSSKSDNTGGSFWSLSSLGGYFIGK